MPLEIGLFREAISEIKSLRRKNELMKARLDMFDSINAILHTKVAEQNEGMSPDLVYQIEKFITSKDTENAKHGI